MQCTWAGCIIPDGTLEACLISGFFLIIRLVEKAFSFRRSVSAASAGFRPGSAAASFLDFVAFVDFFFGLSLSDPESLLASILLRFLGVFSSPFLSFLGGIVGLQIRRR